ncbi:hypothetical protein WISP_47074 [Willisornis vidua]|uniref:Muscle-restricted coiled-coil protein n=1 Tax=Willisornis vidua TaxID=1566151 RepID=A0ABQ9DJG1_9PASS|nr:hypothetical protein WISP_47074 [Willisornis vidua]
MGWHEIMALGQEKESVDPEKDSLGNKVDNKVNVNSDEYEGSGTEVQRKHSKCGVCKYRAECDEDAENVGCVCNIDCSGYSFNPVCASDGSSYNNPCFVREASCLRQEQIDIRHLGHCSETDDTNAVGKKDDGMQYRPEVKGDAMPTRVFPTAMLLASHSPINSDLNPSKSVLLAYAQNGILPFRTDASDQREDIYIGNHIPCSESFNGYCIHGKCEFIYSTQKASCRCESGYTGQHCEKTDFSILYVVPSRQKLTHVLIAAIIGAVQIAIIVAIVMCITSVIEEEEEQDAAYTIVTVLDKVANIVDSVQASQKRIEEKHREMENAIKTIQIDILKLAQAHGNTGFMVNKLLEKTSKVSSTMKEVRARVERQSTSVRKVKAKQEEMLNKNKFRVVIYQVRTASENMNESFFNFYSFCKEETECPSSLSVIKEMTPGETLEDDFLPPDDLSSDEEYYIEESKATKFKKSGMRRIDDIKKAFSKENIQKTRQNFGKKVNRLQTRIVTPERRERIRQSGERLKQSGIRMKKTISQAAPAKEMFKIHKKNKERTGAEGQEGVQEAGVHIASELAAAEPFTEEISYTEVITKVKKDKNSATKGASEATEIGVTLPEVVLKQERKEGAGGDDDVPLLDLKPSA